MLITREPTPTPPTELATAPSAARQIPSAIDKRGVYPGSGPISQPFAGGGTGAAGVAGALPYFDCMISANETVEIGSSILGVIEKITVERSDYVEVGQVLAVLESRVEQAAVRVAEARAERTVDLESAAVSLKLGRKRLDRATDLYRGKSLSLDLREEVEAEARLAELGLDEAKENHRLARLQLVQAQAALERRTITSPISGFVVERLMSSGEVVDDETILIISQTDPLRVDVILPTQLFGTVAPGDQMEILPEAPLDRPHVTTVSVVDRMLDGASGTFGVRLLLPNPDHSLPGGLRCQARLLKDAQNAGG